jgi:phosphatidylserine/phosphatidylglycerophosphate/cardiolipin synthase-like enzyme
MLHSIASARRSVWMTQLAFDVDCVAYARDVTSDSASPGGETVLAEALLAAVERTPIDVRILLNATLLLDTTRPLRRFFAARQRGRDLTPGTVQVRGLSRFPQLLHCKMVIVDGEEAFLLGSPFANGYWDDPRHRPVDARRPARELGGRPLHDVSLRLTGAPVAELQQIFAELWTASGSPPDSLPDSTGASAGEPALCPRRGDVRGESNAAPVRIVCTSPARVLPDARRGKTQIIDALLDGIADARSLVYVEHQYLSARPVASALAQALYREPDLELIVVLNQNPDVTAYQRWQNRRLAESGLLEHPRAGLFALWSVARGAPGGATATLNQVFVHSKVVVVDDLWATSGSANLDGVSLYSYGDDFTGAVARRIFRNVRNVDVNVVVSDRAVRGSRSRNVAGLRARLWSEHLELPVESLARRPPDGWLPLWRARAAANVAALGRAGAADEMRGFVLPYSARRTPALQLIDLGLHIDPARIDVRFNPGWLEVQFSPNWVRNMFL